MNPHVKRAISVWLFALLAAGAFLAAYSLRFGGEVPAEHWVHMIAACGCAVGVKLFAFCWHRLDLDTNRYVGFHDLYTLAKATTYASIGLTFVDAFLLPYDSIPRSVVLIDWGTTLVAIGLVRSAPRAMRDLKSQFANTTAKRVLIVGADDEGEALLRSLHRTKKPHCKAIGFVDDNPHYHGRQIGGVPVVGSIDNLPKLIAQLSPEEILVAGSLPGRAVREVLAQAEIANVPVRVLPSYDKLLQGSLSVQPRDVAIEDLLRRESVRLDDQAIAKWLCDKTVLVTGSAGSIGSEVCRQLLKLGAKKLVALDRSETGQFFLERDLESIAPGKVEVVLADTNDLTRLDTVFHKYRPGVVFHAAAYKHVPLMERHPGEAVKNIVLSTRNVANAAERYGAESFVMISTDKAVNPTSVMGACKQIAERYVQAMSSGSECRYMTVRFGNVLDSAGSVVPIFREQIARGGPVTVTDAGINRFFMTIPEASQLVVQAGAMGRGGEIFVLDMGEPVRILDLARDMIRLSGLHEGEDIEIQITGLRPGEKMYEELYGESEKHSPTRHEKIMSADSQQQPLTQVINDLSRLEEYVDGSSTEILDVLGEIAPRFVDETAHRRAA